MTEPASLPSVLEFAETHYKIPALIVTGVRCGKPNCKCATTNHRHPTACLYWREGKQSHRRYVRKADVELVRWVIDMRRALVREQRAEYANARTFLRDLNRRMRELERAGTETGLW